MSVIVNGDLSSTRPWATGAQKHLDAGWHVFVLPEKQKFPPEPGRTGWSGVDRDGSGFDKVAVRRNVGLRMPVGVIGVDVDHYDAKRGGDTLAGLEKDLGPLPDTPRLSSRYDPDDSTPDTTSGIRFFKVPSGTILAGLMGDDIEVVQRHHRYAVGAPSVHPKTGRPYRWMDHTGAVELPAVPEVDDLPELPQAWVDRFRLADARGGTTQVANSGMVDLWLSGHRGWSPCGKISAKVEEFREAGGSRHDAMLTAQMGIVSLAASGHHGGYEGLEALHGEFVAALRGESGRDADYEFMSALAGAIGKIAAEPPKTGGCCTLTRGRTLEVEVTADADFADTLLATAGQHPTLGGLYSYSRRLVSIPLMGEYGYREPKDPREHDGLAQIFDMDAWDLITFIHARWYCYRLVQTDTGMQKVHAFTPEKAARALVKRARGETDIPVLRGVTHTPVLREDGTLLQHPGYDESSGMTFLPAPGVVWPEVPQSPTAEQVRAAGGLLTGLVGEFPWVDERDRNNFLALWLAPVLSPILREPGPMGIITAPMMGSGKSLLSKVLRATHGAVMRGRLPSEPEEVRKQITTILMGTSSPIVVWDNCDAVIDSAHLASLTTKPTWSDRVLGQNREIELPAKRVWIVNGNNVSLGGDMARRGLWIEIDPKMPEPWKRTRFEHPDLEQYVEANRGAVIGALLTLVMAWVAAGRPVRLDRTDSFAEWFGTLGGVLRVAGLGEIGNGDRDMESVGREDQELAEVLQAAWDVFEDGDPERSRQFTALEFAEECRGKQGGYSALGEALPAALHDKFREVAFQPSSMSKSLGRYLTSVAGRWTNEGFALDVHKPLSKRHQRRYSVQRKVGGGGDAGGLGFGGVATASPAHDPSPYISDPTPQENIKNLSCVRMAEETPPNPKPPTSHGTLPDLSGVVAFDFETLSAQRLWTEPPRGDFLRCMSVSDGTSTYLTHDPGEMARILLEARWLVGHEAYQYDVPAAARHLGLDLGTLLDKTYDTKVLSYLVFPPPSSSEETRARMPDISRHLDDLGQMLVGTGKTEPIRGIARRAVKGVPMKERPDDLFEAIDWTLPENRDYAMRDAEVAIAVYRALVERLPDRAYAHREARIARLAARMTYRGVGIDMQRVLERDAEDEANRDRLRRELEARWGITSSVKLTSEGKIRAGEVLAAHGIPVEFGKAAYRGTPVPLLGEDQLAGHEGRVDEVGDLARALRGLSTDRALPRNLLRFADPDGRVHPRVSLKQATGRWSVTDPPMTTFGKRGDRKLRDREMIRAREGCVLHAEDYSTLDVRAMAALSGDKAMIERLQPGMDWHRQMALLVWGDDSRRDDAKMLSHAINYNSGAESLAENAGVTLPEAQQIIATINQGFPDLAAFKADIAARAQSGGEVVNGWGRRLNVDPAVAWTQAPGHAGQGYARDCVMEGLLRLDDAGLSQYAVLHIHDEYVFEIPAGEVGDVLPRIHEAMQFERDGVPILTEPSTPYGDPAIWISHYRKPPKE